MARNLDFSKLVPTRDTFTDTDGKAYEFLNKTDFGAVEMARLNRIQDDVGKSMEQLKADPANEEAAMAFEAAVNAALGLLLPKLPRERLGDWTLGQKHAIVEFWNQNQQEHDKAGEAKADQTAPAPA